MHLSTPAAQAPVDLQRSSCLSFAQIASPLALSACVISLGRGSVLAEASNGSPLRGPGRRDVKVSSAGPYSAPPPIIFL